MSVSADGLPAFIPARFTSDQIIQHLQATAVLRPSATLRFNTIDRREAHFEASQYKHQEVDWWGRNADTMETITPARQLPPGFEAPLDADQISVRDKRPTAPTNNCRTVVQRFTSLLFSENRAPRIHVHGDSDTEALIVACLDQMGAWTKWREVRDRGGAAGAVCVTYHLRDGEFEMEVHRSKHITPVWRNRNRWQMAAMLKSYEVDEEVPDHDPKTGNVIGTKIVTFLYRRIITDQVDVVYKRVRLDGYTPVEWEVDPVLSVTHGLGFFPGLWIQNQPDSDDFDGAADFEGAWEMQDTVDRQNSQRNKGTLFNQDPTPVLRADPKDVAQLQGVQVGGDTTKYVGSNGDFKFAEISAAGVQAAGEYVDYLERKASEVTRCEITNPEKLTGAAQSAKAIEMMLFPMIDAADDLRGQYGPAFLAGCQIVERMSRRFMGQTVQLGDGREGEYFLRLPPRVVTADDGTETVSDHKLGPGGPITIKWGPYFAPTEQDKGQKIQNATAANAGGLISLETAVREVAPLFGVHDVEGEIAKVKQEREDMLVSGPMPGDDLLNRPPAFTGPKAVVPPKPPGPAVPGETRERAIGR
jgi:hypothetical protein